VAREIGLGGVFRAAEELLEGTVRGRVVVNLRG